MKYLGYIVSSKPIRVKYDFIKVVSDISEVETDKPLLIVGLSDAKKIASDKFSILHKSFGPNQFWTFGRTEKRDEFEKDIINYYNYIISSNFNNIKYIYLNLLNINYNIIKRLLKLCYSSKEKYIYIWNNMIYILCDSNTVVGFSLEIAEYCGIGKEKIIHLIETNPHNIIRTDVGFVGKQIMNRIKDKIYVIPFIMSLI
jgi:hypothetical protein